VLTLEAIVSTGLVDPTSGTRVPFTVGRVDASNLPVPATNALESIQGKMAGVTVCPSRASRAAARTSCCAPRPASTSRTRR
jgi:hypothetical protein